MYELMEWAEAAGFIPAASDLAAPLLPKGAAGSGFNCALHHRAFVRLVPDSRLRGIGPEYPVDLR